MSVVFLKTALKDMDKLDEKTRKKVIKVTEGLKKRNIKKRKLQGYDKCYRIKVGKYRVLFEIDKKGNIVITRVKLRKIVYRNLKQKK